MRCFMSLIKGNRSWFGGIAALGLAGVVLGATGCASSRYHSEAQAAQDQALEKSVNDALASSTVYKYSGVHVTADEGTVALDGTVPTLAQKRTAGELVARVPGVAKVRNHLAVSALAGSPDVGVVPPARPPY